MPTPEKLQSTLDELHAELDAMDQLDEATREQLRATIAEIQTALSRRSAGAAPPARQPAVEEQSLAERLNDATRGLESTHPELATNLGGVIHALAQMGI